MVNYKDSYAVLNILYEYRDPNSLYTRVIIKDLKKRLYNYYFLVLSDEELRTIITFLNTKYIQSETGKNTIKAKKTFLKEKQTKDITCLPKFQILEYLICFESSKIIRAILDDMQDLDHRLSKIYITKIVIENDTLPDNYDDKYEHMLIERWDSPLMFLKINCSLIEIMIKKNIVETWENETWEIGGTYQFSILKPIEVTQIIKDKYNEDVNFGELKCWLLYLREKYSLQFEEQPLESDEGIYNTSFFINANRLELLDLWQKLKKKVNQLKYICQILTTN